MESVLNHVNFYKIRKMIAIYLIKERNKAHERETNNRQKSQINFLIPSMMSRVSRITLFISVPPFTWLHPYTTQNPKGKRAIRGDLVRSHSYVD